MKDFTEKEKEIILFINIFGKTYSEILSKTFFNSEQIARDFISKMKKKGLVEFKKTGLSKPQNEVRLTAFTKRKLKKSDIKITISRGSIRKISHNQIEQIAYYWLGKIGSVERKSVYHHKNTYYSVPDLVFKTKDLKIHVEIETTQKSRNRYKDIVVRISSDKPDRVLYITESETMMKSLSNAMPLWDKLSYIDIDTMIENIKEAGTVGATKQIQLLPQGEKERIERIKKYESFAAPHKAKEKEPQKEDEDWQIKEISNLKKKIDELQNELSKLRIRHDKEIETEKSKYSKCLSVVKGLKNKSFWKRIFGY